MRKASFDFSHLALLSDSCAARHKTVAKSIDDNNGYTNDRLNTPSATCPNKE